PVRSRSHRPLFQVMFAWQNNAQAELELPGLKLQAIGSEYEISKFDLTLQLGEIDNRILGSLEYATALFDATTIERYAGYLQNLLRAMVTAEEKAIDSLQILSEAEWYRLIVEWNATHRAYPSEWCIHELFEAQVVRTPDAPALVHEDRLLSYTQLNAQANRLAHYLQDLGVGPDAPVAICAQRGIEMVVGALATLKAGGA